MLRLRRKKPNQLLDFITSPNKVSPKKGIMKIRLFQVDAFAERVFEGNPATVCPLKAWLDDSLLQAIAEENNLQSLGVNEDPVTGSAHCELAHYWSHRLGSSVLRAHQLSKRGGRVGCEVKGDRVWLSGKAVDYMVAEIQVTDELKQDHV